VARLSYSFQLKTVLRTKLREKSGASCCSKPLGPVKIHP
jgi:hypothetical protein